jgi:hypothetical protein
MRDAFPRTQGSVQSAECDENVRNSLFSSEQHDGRRGKKGDDLSTIALRIAPRKGAALLLTSDLLPRRGRLQLLREDFLERLHEAVHLVGRADGRRRGNPPAVRVGPESRRGRSLDHSPRECESPARARTLSKAARPSASGIGLVRLGDRGRRPLAQPDPYSGKGEPGR